MALQQAGLGQITEASLHQQQDAPFPVPRHGQVTLQPELHLLGVQMLRIHEAKGRGTCPIINGPDMGCACLEMLEAPEAIAGHHPRQTGC